MKKLSAFFILISAICMLSGCTEQTAAQINNEPVQIQQPVKAPGADLPPEASDEKGFASETADVWTPAFQLCWNEFIKLTGRNKIEYINGNPALADELNKQKFNKNDLNEKDYYISVTKQTLKHKKEIEKAIKEKFNETSDILHKFQFENVKDEQTNKWFIYSMLLKKFPFIAKYDVLKPEGFNKDDKVKYKYFGFDYKNIEGKENRNKLYQNMKELFYADDNDFAYKLIDKTGTEEMLWYLTDSDKSFDDIYTEMQAKSEKREEYKQKRIEAEKAKYDEPVTVYFSNNYKFPYLHINEEFNFDEELSGRKIKDKNYETSGTYWIIAKTIQTIKFDLDNEGAKLKSEAAISFGDGARMAPVRAVIFNNYNFDRPFVIFLKETGKDKPYFAARIKDGKYLVKAEE